MSIKLRIRLVNTPNFLLIRQNVWTTMMMRRDLPNFICCEKCAEYLQKISSICLDFTQDVLQLEFGRQIRFFSKTKCYLCFIQKRAFSTYIGKFAKLATHFLHFFEICYFIASSFTLRTFLAKNYKVSTLYNSAQFAQ